MVSKILVNVLLVSVSSFLTSPASAGFDKEGNLTLRPSTLKRAPNAAEKGRGFWVKDARTGLKTRLVFNEFYGTDETDHTFLDYEELVSAQIQEDGAYRIHVSVFPENTPLGGDVRLETATTYNLVAHLAPQGFDKNGIFRMTAEDLEKAYQSENGVSIYDQRDGSRQTLTVTKYSNASRIAFFLCPAHLVLTAELNPEDGSYRFKYSTPGLHDIIQDASGKKRERHMNGTDFLDLSATVSPLKSK